MRSQNVRERALHEKRKVFYSVRTFWGGPARDPHHLSHNAAAKEKGMRRQHHRTLEVHVRCTRAQRTRDVTRRGSTNNPGLAIDGLPAASQPP
eukprot:2135562-Pyramimonas_sp.AAC.1